MTPRDELLRKAEDHARATMIGGKAELLPLTHMVRADGKEVVIGTPWRNDTEKQMAHAVLSGLMRVGDVIRYSVLCEAWSAVAPEGFDPKDMTADPPIRERPDRTEIVMAIAVDRAGHDVRVWETKRDANGNCIDLVLDEDMIDHEGAFLHLLWPDA
jgi:hypothetical protein